MNILIVDDSKTMRHVLKGNLKELGYVLISEADSVPDALLAIKKEKPDLIISDWNMPGESGLDLLKHCKTNDVTRDVPFIMLTTETDRTKIIDATKAGLQSYIIKPVNKKILLEKLKELSAAYGFRPPKEEPPPRSSVNNECSNNKKEAHPLSEIIKNEHIPLIVEKIELILGKELTVQEFEQWLSREVFSNDDAKEDLVHFWNLITFEIKASVKKSLKEIK